MCFFLRFGRSDISDKCYCVYINTSLCYFFLTFVKTHMYRPDHNSCPTVLIITICIIKFNKATKKYSKQHLTLSDIELCRKITRDKTPWNGRQWTNKLVIIIRWQRGCHSRWNEASLLRTVRDYMVTSRKNDIRRCKSTRRKNICPLTFAHDIINLPL